MNLHETEERLRDKRKIDELEMKLKDRTQELETYKHSLRRKTAELESFKNQLNKLNDLEMRINKLSKIQAADPEELNRLKQENQLFRRMIAEKDETINKMRSRILTQEDVEKQLNELRLRLSKLNQPAVDPEEMNRLKQQNQLLKKNNQDLQSIIDNELKNLKSSDMKLLEELEDELNSSIVERLQELETANEELNKELRDLKLKTTETITLYNDSLQELEDLEKDLEDYENDVN